MQREQHHDVGRQLISKFVLVSLWLWCLQQNPLVILCVMAEKESKGTKRKRGAQKGAKEEEQTVATRRSKRTVKVPTRLIEGLSRCLFLPNVTNLLTYSNQTLEDVQPKAPSKRVCSMDIITDLSLLK